MLTAIVCAILTGAHGYRAIAQWTRSQNAPVWQWLGFRRKPPCANSFRNLLLALEPEVLEAALRQWMATVLKLPVPDDIEPVAMDGKSLCNTLAAHERNVHLLSLLDQATGGVLSQQAVPPTTNEAKTALDLLKTIVLKGRVVTGDAMFCQRDLCQQIVDSGGDYLFVIKDNQPELFFTRLEMLPSSLPWKRLTFTCARYYEGRCGSGISARFSPRHRKAATSVAI